MESQEKKEHCLNNKKLWNSPDLFVLATRETKGGAFEETYEDDRNYNPIVSP